MSVHPPGSSSRRTPVRLSTPAEIVAAVPQLCGYLPTQSLVAVSLRGPRRRVGLTIRLDLPRTASAAVDQVISRLRHDGAQAAVFVLYADTGRCRSLSTALCQAAAREQLDVVDVLLVQAGRWWSLLCERTDCCPPGGTPLLPAPTPATTSLAAAVVLGGRTVLASRAELVGSLAPPPDLAVAGRRCQAAVAEFWSAAAQREMTSVRRESVAAFRLAVASARPGQTGELPLLAALLDVRIRDEVATLALDGGAELLAVLMGLARVSAGRTDAPVCTLVAVVAWLRGDGALANVALDRALAADPDYVMARLLRAGLDSQLPPAAVRQWLLATRADLAAA